MTDHPDIERLAAGLTKAQREAVKRGTGSSRTVAVVWRFRPALFGSSSWSAGVGSLSRPTELGLALRDHLKKS